MKLMAIDGNSIINRAFYGIRHLSASDGTPTNAVYGFLAVLQKLLNTGEPDAICVTFDLPAPTFRHKQYEQYKAHRKGMPDELAVQMPILKEILDAMNIPRLELEGWEADDLLGTLAKRCENEGWECIIVTGDKDALQLVTEKTTVKYVKTRGGQNEWNDYTPGTFAEEYGFEPGKIIDLKALMGDSSDNIPGIAGVGEKTAMELVQRFGTIGEIYDKIDSLDIKETLRAKLKNGHSDALLSYELAEIHTDAPVKLPLTDTVRKAPDNDRLYELFLKLRFISFIDKFRLKPPATGDAGQSILSNAAAGYVKTAPEAVTIISKAEGEELLKLVKKSQCVCLRIDTDFFDTVAVAVRNDDLPGGGNEAADSTVSVLLLKKGTTENFDNILKTLLSGEVRKSGHEVKDTLRKCKERGSETAGWDFDTALAAYLISPTEGNYELKKVSGYYCGYTPGADSEGGGNDDGGDGQMSLLRDSSRSLAGEVFAASLLKASLDEKLESAGLKKLFCDIEMPLCGVLAQMEHTGFLIDKEALFRFGEGLSGTISKTETQIYELAGETFNINSPKQLGSILFEKMKLPAPKKTKTGYSTNVEVLDSLLGRHPVIALLKDYRELTKLKSTYVDGLLRVIAPDGRIHTHFQMTATSTGRLSSTEPNLQNIPIRREIGGELRRMFIAPEGSVLVGADYSQIELRLLAHISNDEAMCEAFRSGEDIHTVTASQVFGVPVNEITPVHRTRAKAVNFGIVYGISAFSLAGDIGVTTGEAKEYIENYFNKYPGVYRYMSNVIEHAAQTGYVSTLYGRRRAMPELKSANHNTRSFGERVARNMPIQGTAADIMKIAMINVSRALREEGLCAQMIMQVHDELIVECPEREAEAVSKILREQMEQAAQLSIPLVADTHTGKSWFETK